jgi:hypothetical protein
MLLGKTLKQLSISEENFKGMKNSDFIKKYKNLIRVSLLP